MKAPLNPIGHYFIYTSKVTGYATNGIVGCLAYEGVKSTENIHYFFEDIIILDEIAPKEEWANFKPNFIM